jgi:hypothetical protein
VPPDRRYFMGVLIACSSSAHRNLDLLPTREVPDRTGTRAVRLLRLTVSPARRTAPRISPVVRCPADPGPERPGETTGGGPPGRNRQRWGVRKHPGRAAYREDRGRIHPRSSRCAADRSWPLAPCNPHRFAQGMRRYAFGQTRLSLPPRTDLTPLGQESKACSLKIGPKNDVARVSPGSHHHVRRGQPRSSLRSRPSPLSRRYSPGSSPSPSSSVSGRMSMRQPVRRAARRAFWPSLPMASDSW